MEIRSGGAQDLPALTALYNHFVVRTAITFDTAPFQPAARREWLQQFALTGPHQLFVAIKDGRLAGYAHSTRHRAKPAYAVSVETTVYVDPAQQRSGVGAALYEHLFAALSGEDVHSAFAGIALPNPGSVAFHKRFGFTEIGVFHEVGRKFDRFHDVLWLEKRL